ncbi:LysM peptidoglycan-binding domain-containing protein [Roseovarius sp. SYSU LYC5161]|uniref:LysM peptidoglycan-binding domain-containing protein n=1 Tax=Roseovarius halophilus (ex Wu et al. 2025) TaxID=3376060 RepID=UPI00399C392A
MLRLCLIAAGLCSVLAALHATRTGSAPTANVAPDAASPASEPALKVVSLRDPQPAGKGASPLEDLIIPASIGDADRTGPGARIYTVQPGDNLASISYRFYGRTDRHADILDANRDSLSPSTRIVAGQRLVIPEF